MNPYDRFRTVSSFLSAALVLSGIVAAGPSVRTALAAFAGPDPAIYWTSIVAASATLH